MVYTYLHQGDIFQMQLNWHSFRSGFLNDYFIMSDTYVTLTYSISPGGGKLSFSHD